MITTEEKALQKLLQDYKKYVESDEYHQDNDWPHYIYEAAVEAYLGKDFWKIINSKE